MNSIQELSYSGWEGLSVSKGMESALKMGESIKNLALPIIEAVGKTISESFLEGAWLGSLVAVKIIQASIVMATAGSMVTLALVGVAATSFVIWDLTFGFCEIMNEESKVDVKLNEELKVVRNIVDSEVTLQVEDASEEKTTLEIESAILAITEGALPDLKNDLRCEKREVAIDSGDIY